MEEILEKLNNLTPVFLIGGLSFFMVLEAWRPYFERSAGRRKQRWRNVVMIAIGAAASFATSGLVVVSVAWSEANSFGALYRFFGHSALSIPIGIPSSTYASTQRTSRCTKCLHCGVFIECIMPTPNWMHRAGFGPIPSS
jgi:hypothetical protein